MKVARAALLTALTLTTAGGFLPLASASTPAGPVSAPVATKCTITGTAGNDVLQGTSRSDVICGLGGTDTLVGAGGNDRLIGGSGNDTLKAGAGKDDLIGGAGTDRLTSGPGRDLCADDSADTRTDECEIDTTGPAVSEIEAPTSIAAGSQLTITWQVADPAGVTNTNLFVGGPSGYVDWCPFGQAGTLIGGDDRTGTYTASCDIPANAVSSDYSIFVGASDVFGNQTSQDGPTFTVTGGSANSAAPVTSDLTVPAAVAPGDTIVLQWRTTDDTGVDYTFPWISGSDGNLIGPDGQFYAAPDSNESTLISGTDTDGVYELSLTVSSTIPVGTYIVRFTNGDVLGNSIYEPYTDEQGNEVGFTIY